MPSNIEETGALYGNGNTADDSPAAMPQSCHAGETTSQSQSMEGQDSGAPKPDHKVALKKKRPAVDVRFARAWVSSFTWELEHYPEKIAALLALATDQPVSLSAEMKKEFQGVKWLGEDGVTLRDDVRDVFLASYRVDSLGHPCFVDPFLPQNTGQEAELHRLEKHEEAFLQRLIPLKRRPGDSDKQGRS